MLYFKSLLSSVGLRPQRKSLFLGKEVKVRDKVAKISIKALEDL
jgi:hypothetical protein